MLWRPFGIYLAAAVLVGATDTQSQDPVAPPATVLRVASATPGHEVRFRGVLLVLGQPMLVIEQATPFEFHPAADLVLGAFERQGQGPLLRLELISPSPEPTVVIAPRVLIGQRVGGVATDFVQGY
jgi:hypothetical protein